jgi:hypothetical protein
MGWAVRALAHYPDAVGIAALLRALTASEGAVVDWALVALVAALLRAPWRVAVFARLGHWIR